MTGLRLFPEPFSPGFVFSGMQRYFHPRFLRVPARLDKKTLAGFCHPRSLYFFAFTLHSAEFDVHVNSALAPCLQDFYRPCERPLGFFFSLR